MQDTIAAVATPPGRGGVGIIRLSGPRAPAIATAMAGRLPPPRQAALRSLRDADGRVLDEAVLLYFPGPGSFTGEDVVELQAHGSPIVLESLLRAAVAAGARRARPGEFSERAFLNGRIDLAQAEAIADLIDAGSEAAARAARASLAGDFSREVDALAGALVDLRVWIEGALDFSDEDVDWLAAPQLGERLAAAEARLATLLDHARSGRRLTDGLTIALAGAPNSGKSTLLNRLAGDDLAIVTDIPGTTRDILRTDLILDGLPVRLSDTAGLRDADDPIEREGIRRARAALGDAELVLYLIDDAAGPDAADLDELARLPATARILVLRNKADLSGRAPGGCEPVAGHPALRICARSGAGLDVLKTAILQIAGLGEREAPYSARARHLEALSRTQAELSRVRDQLHGSHPELAAESLRLAHEALGEITGRFGSEDLLGEIFSRFCIGK